MPAKILTVLLILQGALFYRLSHGEPAVATQPLNAFPNDLSEWRMLNENPMDDEVKETLRADDYLSRAFTDPHGNIANLFVAFFKSQRAGQTPHSPKNCLPGSGWIWSVSDIIPISIPGRPDPIQVNRYIVSKGDDKAAVLYWYQSRQRVIASEYRAAVFTAWDSLRYDRTDTALIRVVIPIARNRDDVATRAGVEFVQTVFPVLRGLLPN